MIRKISRRAAQVTVALVGVLAIVVGTAQPALARVVRPLDQYGPCGSHFILSRSGSQIRVVGTQLDYFLADRGLVWITSYPNSYGTYIAYANGGMNVTFNSDSRSARDFRVALTNYENTYTLCASVYRK